MAFNDFDLATFWQDSDYARQQYVDDPPSAELIASIEEELGVRLPAAYLELMRIQNGGIPRNCCFPTDEPTSWADDHVAISGIFGVGRNKIYSLCGDLGSPFMQEEWGYPDIGICICNCPSAGHDMIMLDYRQCGPEGEPRVVHVDQEDDYKITYLANNFEEFIRGLVHESQYDTSEEDLRNALHKIDHGSLSTALAELISNSGEAKWEPILRNLCRTLTIRKGYFALHADELSLLVYDLLFLLFTTSHRVTTPDEYLERYPELIVFGDGDFHTGGYAPDFLKDWITMRTSEKAIVQRADDSLAFDDTFLREINQKVVEFE